MKTEIFKNLKDFEFRKDKNINGVTDEFLISNNLTLEEASKTLIKCIGCFNCYNCKYCNNCENCNTCLYSTDCSNCLYCENCVNCENCNNCKDCIDCDNCSNCNNCLYCTNCLNCNICDDCNSCSNCKKCNNCNNCNKCYKCENLINYKPLFLLCSITRIFIYKFFNLRKKFCTHKEWDMDYHIKIIKCRRCGKKACVKEYKNLYQI